MNNKEKGPAPLSLVPPSSLSSVSPSIIFIPPSDQCLISWEKTDGVRKERKGGETKVCGSSWETWCFLPFIPPPSFLSLFLILSLFPPLFYKSSLLLFFSNFSFSPLLIQFISTFLLFCSPRRFYLFWSFHSLSLYFMYICSFKSFILSYLVSLFSFLSPLVFPPSLPPFLPLSLSSRTFIL